MNSTLAKLITGVLFAFVAASARADAVTQNTIPDASAGTAFLLGSPAAGEPAALGFSVPGFLTDPASEAFAASSGPSSPADIGYYPLNSGAGFAANPVRTLEAFAATGPKVSVPLPEPSSETSLYVLSGVAGLALVVLRRRTLV